MKTTLLELRKVIRRIIREELDLTNEELQAVVDGATPVRYPAREFPQEVWNAMEAAKDQYLESRGKEENEMNCTYSVSSDGQYYIIVIADAWTRSHGGRPLLPDPAQAYIFTADGSQVDELEI